MIAGLRRRRRGSERGAILVELALIGPVLMFLVLAIFEVGLMWRTTLTLSYSVRAGARVSSSVTNGPLSDHATVAAVGSAIASINGRATIDWVVIYKVTSSTNTDPPAACITAGAIAAGGSAGSFCNAYTDTKVAAILADPVGSRANFGAASCSGKWDANWCPVTRITSQAAAGGPDHVGIAVSITYTSVTKLFGTTKTMTDHAVMRLEPIANLGS